MNILLYDFLNSYIQHDLVHFLVKMGHTCNNVRYDKGVDKYEDEAFESMMEKDLANGTYDLVFTTNFWPVVSKICNKHDIKYISWFFDSPPNLPDERFMDNPCNYIFFFARADYETYSALGLENVYYMPLAVNRQRLSKVVCDRSKYAAEISFVGNLYESILPDIKAHMTDFQKGYIDAVCEAQRLIYGGYIIDDLITEDFAKEVREHYKTLSDKAIQLSRKEITWAMASFVTRIERISLLKLLSKRHQTRLYTFNLTDEEKELLSGVECLGSVNYLDEMPQVFMASKINLCPVLKANRSGIPLRALDIMGCGGFLLSSYQSELDEYFENGRECVMYGSIEEAIELADYYLERDSERENIARAGLIKIERDFKYEDRIKAILEISGCE